MTKRITFLSVLAAGTLTLGMVAGARSLSAETPSDTTATQMRSGFVDNNGDGLCDNAPRGTEMAKGKGRRSGPGDGTGNSGDGPKDGTGYGAQDGSKGNGGGTGDCDGTGPKGKRGGGQGRRGGRR